MGRKMKKKEMMTKDFRRGRGSVVFSMQQSTEEKIA
jgi:hypothetical protein